MSKKKKLVGGGHIPLVYLTEEIIDLLINLQPEKDKLILVIHVVEINLNGGECVLIKKKKHAKIMV